MSNAAQDAQSGLVGRGNTIGVGGRPAGPWKQEFQAKFRNKLADPAAEVLHKVMLRALDTSDIDAAMQAAEADSPAVFATLEGEKNERFAQAVKAATTALKHILPVPKDVPEEDPKKSQKGLSKSVMDRLSPAELLQIVKMPSR